MREGKKRERMMPAVNMEIGGFKKERDPAQWCSECEGWGTNYTVRLCTLCNGDGGILVEGTPKRCPGTGRAGCLHGKVYEETQCFVCKGSGRKSG